MKYLFQDRSKSLDKSGYVAVMIDILMVKMERKRRSFMLMLATWGNEASASGKFYLNLQKRDL